MGAAVRYVDYGSVDAADLDVDGLRYNLRGFFNLTPELVVGLDLRFARLKADNADSVDLDEDDIRLAARWYF